MTSALVENKPGTVSLQLKEEVVVYSLTAPSVWAGKHFEKQVPVVSCQLSDRMAFGYYLVK